MTVVEIMKAIVEREKREEWVLGAEKKYPLPTGCVWWKGEEKYEIYISPPMATSTVSIQAGVNERGRPIWEEREKIGYNIGKTITEVFRKEGKR